LDPVAVGINEGQQIHQLYGPHDAEEAEEEKEMILDRPDE
jgi:hypothetical protein